MNPLMGGNAATGPSIPGINPQAVQSVKRMMGMLQAAKNPQQAIMQAAQQNPMLGNILQMCNGKNPKDVFYQQCQKMGVDPDSVISQLR